MPKNNMPDEARILFAGEIRRRLRTLVPTPASPARPAAVLVPVYHHAGEWHILLTERTHTVAEHRGQVAFPGGKADPGDRDRIETALRETEEEIGMPAGHVEVLGVLPDFVTITDYHVTPVVGIIPWPAELRLSAAELSEAFGVPLRWLADPAHLRVEYWNIPGRPDETPVYFYDYGNHTIWGATARMLHAFVELAKPLLEASFPERPE
ncbi:MAG TPA: CoA pyrophosphatase [Arenibaculum sp.]|nr:CoA pyrophosphatase [Arenibaculum sp.]